MRFKPVAKRRASQKTYVLNALQSGAKLTPMTALNSFGVFRLAAVIHDLRKAGHTIKTTEVTNRNGAKFAQYTLESN